MVMARTKTTDGQLRRPGNFRNWVDKTLFLVLGPPPLGPYTEETNQEAHAEKAASYCPICNELMSIHDLDRSGERTQIYHPSPEESARRRAALSTSPEQV